MNSLLRGVVLSVFLLWGAVAAPEGALRLTEIKAPTTVLSQTPYLVSSQNATYASWIEGESGKQSLRMAAWDGKNWSAASTVISGVPMFVNWADFPSIVPLSNGAIAAQWLQKTGSGTYAYHVQMSLSQDGGKTWSAPQRLHDDKSENEHGFASLVPQGNAELMAAWLDGRKFQSAEAHAPGNEMQLMGRKYSGGKLEAESVVDPRVCDCCQTTAVAVPDGVLVAYRDRSADEVRDISISRFATGKWSAPQTLNADGWKIAGCPVNGPAAASEGKQVVVVWFTAAQDKPRVLAIFSADGGKTFGKPVRVDGGNPTGRVDVELMADGSALVSWLENTAGKGADIRIRKVHNDGKMAEPQTVAPSATARASGFPRLTRRADSILIAWTDIADDKSRIRIFQIQ